MLHVEYTADEHLRAADGVGSLLAEDGFRGAALCHDLDMNALSMQLMAMEDSRWCGALVGPHLAEDEFGGAALGHAVLLQLQAGQVQAEGGGGGQALLQLHVAVVDQLQEG